MKFYVISSSTFYSMCSFVSARIWIIFLRATAHMSSNMTATMFYKTILRPVLASQMVYHIFMDASAAVLSNFPNQTRGF